MTARRLWLVRHAAPIVAPGTCYGTLDVEAHADATLAAAHALAAALPARVRVATSPRLRCRALARALAGLRPDAAAEVDARLAEMDFGDWEGLAWTAIPQASLQAWTDDFAHYRAGGGESVAAVMQRVGLAYDAAMHAAGPGDVVWITHAGVIRAATLLAQGVRMVARADQWPAQAPGFGTFAIIDL